MPLPSNSQQAVFELEQEKQQLKERLLQAEAFMALLRRAKGQAAPAMTASLAIASPAPPPLLTAPHNGPHAGGAVDAAAPSTPPSAVAAAHTSGAADAATPLFTMPAAAGQVTPASGRSSRVGGRGSQPGPLPQGSPISPVLQRARNAPADAARWVAVREELDLVKEGHKGLASVLARTKSALAVLGRQLTPAATAQSAPAAAANGSPVAAQRASRWRGDAVGGAAVAAAPACAMASAVASGAITSGSNLGGQGTAAEVQPHARASTIGSRIVGARSVGGASGGRAARCAPRVAVAPAASAAGGSGSSITPTKREEVRKANSKPDGPAALGHSPSVAQRTPSSRAHQGVRPAAERTSARSNSGRRSVAAIGGSPAPPASSSGGSSILRSSAGGDGGLKVAAASKATTTSPSAGALRPCVGAAADRGSIARSTAASSSAVSSSAARGSPGGIVPAARVAPASHTTGSKRASHQELAFNAPARGLQGSCSVKAKAVAALKGTSSGRQRDSPAGLAFSSGAFDAAGEGAAAPATGASSVGRSRPLARARGHSPVRSFAASLAACEAEAEQAAAEASVGTGSPRATVQGPVAASAAGVVEQEGEACMAPPVMTHELDEVPTTAAVREHGASCAGADGRSAAAAGSAMDAAGASLAATGVSASPGSISCAAGLLAVAREVVQEREEGGSSCAWPDPGLSPYPGMEYSGVEDAEISPAVGSGGALGTAVRPMHLSELLSVADAAAPVQQQQQQQAPAVSAVPTDLSIVMGAREPTTPQQRQREQHPQQQQQRASGVFASGPGGAIDWGSVLGVLSTPPTTAGAHAHVMHSVQDSTAGAAAALSASAAASPLYGGEASAVLHREWDQQPAASQLQPDWQSVLGLLGCTPPAGVGASATATGAEVRPGASPMSWSYVNPLAVMGQEYEASPAGSACVEDGPSGMHVAGSHLPAISDSGSASIAEVAVQAAVRQTPQLEGGCAWCEGWTACRTMFFII